MATAQPALSARWPIPDAPHGSENIRYRNARHFLRLLAKDEQGRLWGRVKCNRICPAAFTHKALVVAAMAF